VRFLLQLVLIAVTACFSTTATANSNHDVTMNEAKKVISSLTEPIKFTEEQTTNFWAKVEKLGTEAGCWIWTGSTNPDRYGCFGVNGRTVGTHRISWFLHHGPIPTMGGTTSLKVLHHCDTPECVNPAHLWLGTQLENIADCLKKGRHNHAFGGRVWTRECPEIVARGERSHKAKLTSDKVAEIRALYKTGAITQVELSSRFGINQSSISALLLRRTWAHIA
jgi:hypothetical protein